uniref:Uncharacterized protein n=1 Tax=Rhizophora mucronata TaxID=61149 RepID=A0A2P2QD27_RHIMU
MGFWPAVKAVASSASPMVIPLKSQPLC